LHPSSWSIRVSDTLKPVVGGDSELLELFGLSHPLVPVVGCACESMRVVSIVIVVVDPWIILQRVVRVPSETRAGSDQIDVGIRLLIGPVRDFSVRVLVKEPMGFGLNESITASLLVEDFLEGMCAPAIRRANGLPSLIQIGLIQISRLVGPVIDPSLS
jgi:hypothetical protein